MLIKNPSAFNLYYQMSPDRHKLSLYAYLFINCHIESELIKVIFVCLLVYELPHRIWADKAV